MTNDMHRLVSRRRFGFGALATGSGGAAFLALPTQAEAKSDSLPCRVGEAINLSEAHHDKILDALADGLNLEALKKIRALREKIDKNATRLLDGLKKNIKTPEVRHMLRREQQEMLDYLKQKEIPEIPEAVTKYPQPPRSGKEDCPENISPALVVFKYILEALGANISFEDLINLMTEFAYEEKILDQIVKDLKDFNMKRVSKNLGRLIDLVFSKRFVRKLAESIGEKAMTKFFARFAGRLVPFIGYAIIITDVVMAAVNAYDFIKKQKECSLGVSVQEPDATYA